MNHANPGFFSPPETIRLRESSPKQWKSGLAAWLGWAFDGLKLHLYTLVALPFVAEFLGGLVSLALNEHTNRGNFRSCPK